LVEHLQPGDDDAPKGLLLSEAGRGLKPPVESLSHGLIPDVPDPVSGSHQQLLLCCELGSGSPPLLQGSSEAGVGDSLGGGEEDGMLPLLFGDVLSPGPHRKQHRPRPNPDGNAM